MNWGPVSPESERFSLQVGTKKYNSLGGILALLTSQMPEIKLQQDLDLSMDAGRVLNLFRIRPGSGKQSNDSRGQTLVATAQSCCTSKEKPSACKAEALQSCFSGKHPFKVDPKLTAGPPVAGTIKDGTLALGRGDLPLRISYFGSGILDFVLHHASLRGKISSDGITEGVITGALSQYQICNVVIPTAARYFSEQYSDPKADQKTKDLLKTLFDSNKDGKITNAEVATNGLVKTFMDGDMDLDGDGAKELSIGVGFSAVLAKITH